MLLFFSFGIQTVLITRFSSAPPNHLKLKDLVKNMEGTAINTDMLRRWIKKLLLLLLHHIRNIKNIYSIILRNIDLMVTICICTKYVLMKQFIVYLL